MENVKEIQEWGPLDDKGYPIPENKGEDYQKFIGCMKKIAIIVTGKPLSSSGPHS